MTLTLEGLSCQRGGRVLFQGVSHTLLPGESLLIQGRNGVGKTTLLETLAGLHPLSQGKVFLDARPITHEDFRFVMVKGGLKEDLTVGDHASFWQALYGGTPSQRQEGLEAFGLLSLSFTLVGRLSSGQRQRLNLMRLFLGQARVWLLDEPFARLDTPSRQTLLRCLKNHLSAGGMAVLSDHGVLEDAHHKRLCLDDQAPRGQSLHRLFKEALHDAALFS